MSHTGEEFKYLMSMNIGGKTISLDTSLNIEHLLYHFSAPDLELNNEISLHASRDITSLL